MLYAETPGAFVDLAADVAYLQRVRGPEDATDAADGDGDGHQPAVALDADLPPESVIPGLSGLREYEMVNQAVGVLVERGHAPSDAHAALRRDAAIDGLALPDYAARLIQK